MTIWWIIIGGLLSVIYGVVTTSSLMKADAGQCPHAGNLRAPIAEGAQAYLNRQYHDDRHRRRGHLRAGGWLLGLAVGIGFVIGAVLSGAAGYIGMNVSVRANVRTAQAASTSLPAASTSPSRRARSPACWWLVSRCWAWRSTTWVLTGPLGMKIGDPGSRVSCRRAGGARLRRFADFDLRPSGRRHLHQGRRRRRRSRRQGGSRHSGRRSAQPGDHRRQRRRQRRRLRGHGGRPVRNLCRDGCRDHGSRGDLLRRQADARSHRCFIRWRSARSAS
jgi:hypothetical protein